MKESIRVLLQKESFAAVLAISIWAVSFWLLNTEIYSRFDSILPEARDIATLCSAVVALLLTIVAMQNPRLLRESIITPIAIVLYIGGVGIALFGVSVSSSLIITIGACIRATTRAWFFLLIGMTLSCLDAKTCAATLVSAFVLKYLWMFVFEFLPSAAGISLVVLAPVIVVTLIRKQALKIFSLAGFDAQADISITSPQSFLPFTHTLFIAIVVFKAANGYSLTFDAVASNPQTPLLTFVPMLVLALVVFRTNRLSADRLFQVVIMLVLAGFLLIPVLTTSLEDVTVPFAQVFLMAGSDFFTILVVYVLASLASRNLIAAAPMFLFANAAIAFGTELGAGLGHATNSVLNSNASLFLALLALIIFCFVWYSLIVLKNFSFEETIRSVTAVKEVQLPMRDGWFDEKCNLVAEHYKLTPRETDIMELLARGRNSQAIQDKLVVSRNTVKTHVRNIYAKLDVHSQQELIDLVESSDAL